MAKANSAKMLSSILVIGGTGMIGQHLVTASLDAGHPTAVLVRPATADADAGKAKLIEAFQSCGARLVYGDINEHEGLVAAIKQADVVFSAVGHSSREEVEGQLKIVAAIQEAGGVKRFLPSEYGCDVELAEQMLEPARSILGAKRRVREAVRAAGIPHTIISSNWFQGFLLPRAGNPEANGPPDNSVTIFGDGKLQVFFVNEKDMAAVAMKAVEDPRTLNKILHLRHPKNLCSLDQLVSLWENKIGKTLKKTYVREEELVKKVQESPFPLNFQLAVVHATLVAREAKLTEKTTTNGASSGDEVEATALYPDMNYVTVEHYLDSLP
ncbi:hypothetical protein GQ55_5G287400 [Panicum hallii var. hallii]|uniref:NmrA-like domain-containing protein n=1 Tax=Panicum hallii var. hallii TaxID=1504633 RepID=A0A2T7DL74_9POAL|nr:hypothetical protein GQ55_5G287400 [Panicum hallii var. hallii]